MYFYGLIKKEIPKFRSGYKGSARSNQANKGDD
jgi:hypothetical protein